MTKRKDNGKSAAEHRARSPRIFKAHALVRVDGEAFTYAEIAERAGIDMKTAHSRVGAIRRSTKDPTVTWDKLTQASRK